MLTTSAKTAMRGTLAAAKRTIPDLIANQVASSIANAAKTLEKVDIDVTRSPEPLLKKASVVIGGIDINALIDGSGIVLDQQNDWGIYTRTSRNQCYR